MDSEIKRAYGRGYNAGSRHRWAQHKPPFPPHEIVARMLIACQNLRDGVDSELALFGADDPVAEHLGPLIDAVDEQFIAISKWLRDENVASGN